MARPPDWLPPMLSVNPWRHDTFEIIYSVFEHDFKETQPAYKGKIVWFFPEVDAGRESIFWHLTHRNDEKTNERLPDMRRCERFPWVRAIIDNSEEAEVLDWDYREGDGSIKTYLWLRDFDFLVILKKYPDGKRRLITSYHIDFPHKRRKLEKKYRKRIL